MKLREQILKEHSKANCQKIVQWVGGSQKRFDELFDLFLNDEYRVVQRAAWPMSYAVEANPELIRPHFAKLFKNLKKPGIHNSVVRNTLRLLQEIDVPEEYEGELMDTCFKYISDPAEMAAVKAFSLTVLENLSKKYSEIRPELKLIIEENWNHEGAAFRSRAKKILKRMSK